jgi:LAGLIDADG endonuclease
MKYFIREFKSPQKNNFHPYKVTGFCDHSASFIFGVNKKSSFEFSPKFEITVHSRNINILHLIKKFFRVGEIYTYKNKSIYRITKRKELINIILLHFNKYPLISSKYNIFIV